jgi:hypothetical protein
MSSCALAQLASRGAAGCGGHRVLRARPELDVLVEHTDERFLPPDWALAHLQHSATGTCGFAAWPSSPGRPIRHRAAAV